MLFVLQYAKAAAAHPDVQDSLGQYRVILRMLHLLQMVPHGLSRSTLGVKSLSWR